mgnify:CR=1 FL=1
MMTNLLNGAHVANKLFSTIARLRLLLVMFVALTVSANAWGATYTHSFNTTGTVSVSNNSVTLNNVTWSVATTKGKGSPTYTNITKGYSYCGWQFGSSKDNYYSKVILSTNAFSSYNVQSVVLNMRLNGGVSTTMTVKQGSTTIGTATMSTANVWTDLVANSTKGTGGDLSITIATTQAFYIHSITVTYEEAVSCTEPTISTQPTGATYTKDDSPTTLSVVASGDDLTYQWYSNTSNSTSGATKINGATNSTYTPSTSTVGTKYYYCIVSSGSCSTTSNIVSVVVENPPFTVTLNAGSGTCAESVTEPNAGDGVTLPTPTLSSACQSAGWSFAGWKTTSAVATETTTKPTLIAAGDYEPTSNITLYAVYQRTDGGGGGGTTSVTFTDEDSGGWTTTAGEQNGTKDGVSISTNDGIYSQNNNQLRVYKYATFTVSSENIITSIVFSLSNYDWSDTSGGDYSNKTWTGNTNSVTFTADNGQVRITQLVVTVSAGGSFTTYYHSTPECGSTQPSLSADPTNLDFGEVTVGQSQQKTFALTGQNIKNATTLSISGESHGFSVSPFGIDDTGNFEKEITVTYEPTTAGNHSQTIVISSEGADNVTVSLSGTGTAQMANYTVKHYKQNLDGTYPTEPTETEYPSGEVETTVTPAVKSYEGFTAPSTTEVTIAADGSTVVEYLYTRNSHTLTWILDGGNITTDGTAAGTVKYGASLTAPVVEKDGYNFKGWNPSVPSQMPDADATYTAQWTKVHTITWNVAGDESNTTTVLDGEKVVLPSDPKSCSDVYTTFVGWYTEPAGGESNSSAAPLGTQITATTEPDGDKTYYAVWADGSSEGGEELKTTLDFSSNENWKIPSGNSNKTVTENQYSNGTYTIKLAGSTNNGYYYNSNQVLLGKNGAYLELPAFSFKVSKIVSTTPTATVSGSVTWNVFTGETPVSSLLTGCTSGGTFEIDKDYQTEGTIYTIKVTNANNLQIKKLEIYGPIAGAIGYISTCCANSINITKGAEENGTFDVTPLGKTASCDGVTVTVTPQPANHYHVLSVTATNPSTAGSAQVVDNGDGTWNVTYEENSKGDTKIDVTFEEDTKYDVTWYVNGIALTGVELGEASTKVYENDKVEKIPDNPAPPCGGVFVGWTVAEMDVDDTDEPNELYTQQSEFPNATGNQEFYAVFADYDEQQ